VSRLRMLGAIQALPHIVSYYAQEYTYSLYSSINNKMQGYTMVFITINALHISGGSSAHHQELNCIHSIG
jgi:hypothetical protein